MLVSPLLRSFLLLSKILGATILAVIKIYVFLGLATIFGYYMPFSGLLMILPAILFSSIMLCAIVLLIKVYTRQIENFAWMMNFVIFPMFFLSSAIYPLWKLRGFGAQFIYWIATLNPFTHVVEFIRFSAYGQFNTISATVVVSCSIIAFLLAARGYDPNHSAIRRIKRS